MFEIINENPNTIRHEPSGIETQILLNPKDEEDYDVWNDTYQHFQFRGNYIVAKLANADDVADLILEAYSNEDFSFIHSILRKAFKYYKAHNHIEAYTKPIGPLETDRYRLEAVQQDWHLTDKVYSLIIVWSHKQFNDTQTIIQMEEFDAEHFMLIGQILRLAADWLCENHHDKI